MHLVRASVALDQPLVFPKAKDRPVVISALASEAARLVGIAFPRLPKTALQPLFLGGSDLKAAGLRAGPEFSAVLDEAARAQWTGRIASRGEARSWLRDRLRRAG